MSCWFGIISSERIDNEHHFYMELYSFKDEYVIPWENDISTLVVEEIVKWVNWKSKQPLNSPDKPTKLKNNRFHSSCFEVD